MTKTTPVESPIDYLRQRAPWLFEPDLGVAIVGSCALAEACRRANLDPPDVNDIDLAWALDIDSGTRLLKAHDAFVPTTAGSRARGTLAIKLDGLRLEVTSFRGSLRDAPLLDRLIEDLGARDMTVGAIAWSLATDTIHDPTMGLEDWRHRRIVAVGDPAERIREHPIRWLRYYRRAWQWGFEMAASIRRVGLPVSVLREVPAEAIASEVRAALLTCRSPGRWLLDLFEIGLLQEFAPELALQFDGRAAGPVRYHPEVSQALHLILALEWLVTRSTDLDPGQRLSAAIAVLGHDLGKGYTETSRLPSHPGHEEAGVAPLNTLLDRLPGLADAADRRLAESVAILHITARNIEGLRPGTRASLYERWFKQKDFPVRLFALAIGADCGGRLGHDADGDRIASKVATDIEWIRQQCETVDVGALWQQFGQDKARFSTELHQAYAGALRHHPGR